MPAPPTITLKGGKKFPLKDGETVKEGLARFSASLTTTVDGQEVTVSTDDPKAVQTVLQDKLAEIRDDPDSTALFHKHIQEKLRQFAQRVCHLSADIKDLQDERKDVFKVAKIFGFDVKAMKAAIKALDDPAGRVEHNDLTDQYLDVLFGDADGSEIALPGLPKAKADRRKSISRVKKENAEAARRDRERRATLQAAKLTADIRSQS